MLLPRAIDFFLPPHHRDDAELGPRGRLLVGLTLVWLFPMPAFCVLHVLSGDWALFGLTLLGLLVEVGVLLAYRWTGAQAAMAHVLLVLGHGIVVVCLSITGGVHSPIAPIFAVLPLLAFVLLSARWGLAWSVLVAVVVSSFALGESLGWLSSDTGLLGLTPWAFALNLLVLMSYAVGAAAFLRMVERQRRRALMVERERSRAASDAKSTFLANMSHEVRTPMNGVLGLVESLLADPSLSEEHRQVLQTVRGSGRSLVALLDDVLDVSRVESGQLTLESVPVDARRVVLDVENLVGEQARQRGIVLRHTFEHGVRWVWTDPVRLRQIVLNLVSNAVKFTEDGEVRVVLGREGEELVIEVADTGIGMSPEALEAVFQPFVQADASTTRRFGGSGLGLAIVKGLIDQLGGDIRAESTPGEGTRFTVRLPTEEAPPPPPPSLDDERDSIPTGLRVLVVEDHPVNQLVVSKALQRIGAEVRLAADGFEALDALDGDTPDLVLMDIQMPGMDGLEATRRARSAGYAGVILALTASVMDDDRERALSAGVDGVVAKPLDLGRLIRTFRRAHRDRQPGPPAV